MALDLNLQHTGLWNKPILSPTLAKENILFLHSSRPDCLFLSFLLT